MGREKQSAGRHGEEFWKEESRTNIGYKLMAAQGWEQGQGLGKDGGGRTNFIRTKKKTDNLGLGAKQGDDDCVSAMTGMYNELLQRLASGGDNLHANGGASKEAEGEDTSKTLQDYIVKKRLYGRFRKAKDTCGYSDKDMAAIMGKKASDIPAMPKFEAMGYAAVAKVETKTTEEDESGVKTVTSKMSIRDYFSKKLNGSGSRFSAAGGQGFTEEFQENHYNHLSQIADSYTGKMGLGSGRSSDPWEDSYTPSFSMSYTPPPVEKKEEEVKEPEKKKKRKDTEDNRESTEKPKKKKQEIATSPVEPDVTTTTKKSKKDKTTQASSASSSASSLASSPASSSASASLPTSASSLPLEEPTKKKKREKQQESKAVVETKAPEEAKKEKKSKKNKEEKTEEQSCSFCLAMDVAMTCGGCLQAFYCGVECQRSHWTSHKSKCKTTK